MTVSLFRAPLSGSAAGVGEAAESNHLFEKSAPSLSKTALIPQDEALRKELCEKGWIDATDRVIPGAPFPSLPALVGVGDALRQLLEQPQTILWEMNSSKSSGILSHLKRSLKPNEQWVVEDLKSRPFFKSGNHTINESYLNFLRALFEFHQKGGHKFEARLRGGFLRYLLRDWMREAMEKLGAAALDCKIKESSGRPPPDIDILIDNPDSGSVEAGDKPMIEMLGAALSGESEHLAKCCRVVAAHACFEKRAFVGGVDGNEFAIASLKAEGVPSLEVVIAKKLARNSLCTLDRFSLSLNEYLAGNRDARFDSVLIHSSLDGWQTIIDNMAYLLRYDAIETVDTYGLVRHFSHLSCGARASERETAKALIANLKRKFNRVPNYCERIRQELIKKIERCHRNHPVENVNEPSALGLNLVVALQEHLPEVAQEMFAFLAGNWKDCSFSKIIEIIEKYEAPVSIGIKAVSALAIFSYWIPEDQKRPELVRHEEADYLRIWDKGQCLLVRSDLEEALTPLATDFKIFTSLLQELSPHFPVGKQLREGAMRPSVDFFDSGLIKACPQVALCAFRLNPSFKAMMEIVNELSSFAPRTRHSFEEAIACSGLLPDPACFFKRLKKSGADSKSAIILGLAEQREVRFRDEILGLWADLERREAKNVGKVLLKLFRGFDPLAGIAFFNEMQVKHDMTIPERLNELALWISSFCRSSRHTGLVDQSMSLLYRSAELLIAFNKKGSRKQRLGKKQKSFKTSDEVKDQCLWMVDYFLRSDPIKAATLCAGFERLKVVAREEIAALSAWSEVFSLLSIRKEVSADCAMTLWTFSGYEEKMAESSELYPVLLSVCELLAECGDARVERLVALASMLKLNGSQAKLLEKVIRQMELEESLEVFDKPFFSLLPQQKQRALTLAVASKCGIDTGVISLDSIPKKLRPLFAGELLKRLSPQEPVPPAIFSALLPVAKRMSKTTVLESVQRYLHSPFCKGFGAAFIPLILEFRNYSLALDLAHQSEESHDTLMVAEALSDHANYCWQVHMLMKKTKLMAVFSANNKKADHLVDTLIGKGHLEAAIEWMSHLKVKAVWLQSLSDCGRFNELAHLLLRAPPLRDQLALRAMPHLPLSLAVDLSLHYDFRKQCETLLLKQPPPENPAEARSLLEYWRRAKSQGIACVTSEFYSVLIQAMRLSEDTGILELHAATKMEGALPIQYFNALVDFLPAIEQKSKAIDEIGRLQPSCGSGMPLSKLVVSLAASGLEKGESLACGYAETAFNENKALQELIHAIVASGNRALLITGLKGVCCNLEHFENEEDHHSVKQLLSRLIFSVIGFKEDRGIMFALDDLVSHPALTHFFNASEKVEFEARLVMGLLDCQSSDDIFLKIKALTKFLKCMSWFEGKADLEERYFKLAIDLIFQLLSKHGHSDIFVQYFTGFVETLLGKEAEVFLDEVEAPGLVLDQVLKSRCSKTIKNVCDGLIQVDRGRNRKNYVVGTPDHFKRRMRTWRYLKELVIECIEFKEVDFPVRLMLLDKARYLIRCLIREFSIDKNNELIDLVRRFVFLSVPADIPDAHQKVFLFIRDVAKAGQMHLNWKKRIADRVQINCFVNLVPIVSSLDASGTHELLSNIGPMIEKLLQEKCPHMLARVVSIIGSVQFIIPRQELNEFTSTVYKRIFQCLSVVKHYDVYASSVDDNMLPAPSLKTDLFTHVGTALTASSLFAELRKMDPKKRHFNALASFMRKNMQSFYRVVFKAVEAAADRAVAHGALHALIPFIRFCYFHKLYSRHYSNYISDLGLLLDSIKKQLGQDGVTAADYQNLSPWMLFDYETQASCEPALTVSLSDADRSHLLHVFVDWCMFCLRSGNQVLIEEISKEIIRARNKEWFNVDPKPVEKLIESMTSMFEDMNVPNSTLLIVLRLIFSQVESSRRHQEFVEKAIERVAERYAELIEKSVDSDALCVCKGWLKVCLHEEKRDQACEYLDGLIERESAIEKAMCDIKSIQEIVPAGLQNSVDHDTFSEDDFEFDIEISSQAPTYLHRLASQVFELRSKLRAEAWNHFLRNTCFEDQTLFKKGFKLMAAAISRWHWYERFESCDLLKDSIKKEFENHLKRINPVN